MIAVILAPLYIAINVYIFFRMSRWMEALWGKLGHPAVKATLMGVFVFFASSPLLGMIIETGEIHRFFKYVSNYWLGVLGLTTVIILIFDGARLILSKTIWKDSRPSDKSLAMGGACAAVIIILLSFYGVYHGDKVYVRKDEIEVEAEKAGELRIALIADLHLGYNTGEEHIDSIVRAVNESDADIVAVAGDVFDNEYAALKDPERLADRLAEMESLYGTYVCWGNHDVEEKILAGFTFGGKEPESDGNFREFLKEADMTLLEDRKVLIENKFYIAGRKDGSKTEKEGGTRLDTEELLRDAEEGIPVIVMDHQPSDMEEFSEAGADIVLSGHTHNGQIFPANLILKMTYENSSGILEKGGSVSCVTSGAGLWGPPMRIGTDSEVMIIDVKFIEK